ncbi:MAG TPA: hypothetical protein VF389_09160 [Woeseiaceae bacterium]
MPNLESLANLGEVIGAIAVVVSLVYLAVQVRQNTHAQQTENFSRALERVSTMQARLTEDAETSLLVSKGVTDPTELSPRERIQFTFAMYEMFGAFEFMFLASKTDAIPTEVWQRWSAAVAWWLTFPGVQTWWAIRPTPFTGSFTLYVDALLEKNPTVIDVQHRFQHFVAEGSVQSLGRIKEPR